MNHISKDEVIRRIDLAFWRVQAAAIKKARETGTKLVIWRDGKIIHVDPDELENPKEVAAEDSESRGEAVSPDGKELGTEE
jgi:hypothetical protein